MTFLVPPPDWEMGDRAMLFPGVAWLGTMRTAGEAVIERLAALVPDVTVLEPTRWRTFQSGFDAILPHGVRAYWRNAPFEDLDRRLIDTSVEHLGAQTWVGTAADLHHMGGAFRRVPEGDTPSRTAEPGTG